MSVLSHCPACHRAFDRRISKDPICVRVGNEPTQTLGRNQQAAFMRTFLTYPGEKLPYDTMYQALGRSPEVSRTIRQLRKRQIPIVCEKLPKANGTGVYGVYSTGKEVKIWEPGTPEPSGEG